MCTPGGAIVAAVISRFASFHDMLLRDKLTQPGIADIVADDLACGQHRNPDGLDGLFTTAYFHHPDEIASEAESAGVRVDHVIGIEGLAGFADDLHTHLDDEEAQGLVLDFLRDLEEEPSIVGASNPVLASARV